MEKKENNLKSILILFAIILAVILVLVFFKNTPIWNIVVLLLMLSLLIFVHEGGHFIAAKKCGVHVYEFALGMGPKVLSFKRKNDPTEYTLRALPIGGFCAMAGEEGEDDESLDKDKFMCNKSKIKRIIILVAGVTMNFITAIILLFIIGLSFGSTEQKSIIGRIESGSPADVAGLKVNDKIIECNGYKISTWDKLTIVTNLKNKNNYYEYKVEHEDGSVDTYKITPDEYVVIGSETIKLDENNKLKDVLKKYNKKESEVTVSKLVGIAASSEIKKDFLSALKYAFSKFGSIVSTMLLILGSLFTGKLGLSALSGPVGMYSVVGTVASLGFANLIYLTAYLSINLGVLNILPFPAFDGGRVLFVLIEAITRKKVDPKIEGYFHSVGFILIMLLMVYITFQDVLRLF